MRCEFWLKKAIKTISKTRKTLHLPMAHIPKAQERVCEPGCAPTAGPWMQVKSRSSPGVEQACGEVSRVPSSFCLTIMSDLREHSHWRHFQDPLIVENLSLWEDPQNPFQVPLPKQCIHTLMYIIVTERMV